MNIWRRSAQAIEKRILSLRDTKTVTQAAIMV